MDADEVCHTCHGTEWVGYAVAVDDPRFGKRRPCPVCVTRERENTDWFAGLTVTSLNAEAIRLARSMADNPSGWLVIHGSLGTGKTALAKAILSKWAGKEKVPQTVTELLDFWRSKIGEDFETLFYETAKVSLAVLDDLGTEKVTEWGVERLTEYLDWRYRAKLPTVITTNQDADGLAVRVGARIADRVFGQDTGFVRVCTLLGPSFRTGRIW